MVPDDTDTAGRAVDNDESKIKSLEEKSKTSRARVHYRKFTKSKDLTNATKVDLDCILGRHKRKNVVLKEDEEKEEEETRSDSGSSATNEDKKEEVKPESTFITKTNVLSINDYFATKMAEIAQRKQSTLNEVEVTGKKKRKNEETEVEVKVESSEVEIKVESSEVEIKEEPREAEEINGDSVKIKKNKKKKHEDTVSSETYQSVEVEATIKEENVAEEEESEVKTKKKKKKKEKTSVNEIEAVETVDVDEVQKKKKKEEDQERTCDEAIVELKHKTFKENLYKIEDPFKGSNLFDVVGYTPYTVFQSLDSILEEKEKRASKKGKIMSRNLKSDPNFYLHLKKPTLPILEKGNEIKASF